MLIKLPAAVLRLPFREFLNMGRSKSWDCYVVETSPLIVFHNLGLLVRFTKKRYFSHITASGLCFNQILKVRRVTRCKHYRRVAPV